MDRDGVWENERTPAPVRGFGTGLRSLGLSLWEVVQAHNDAYIAPIVKWGEAIHEELGRGWGRTTEPAL